MRILSTIVITLFCVLLQAQEANIKGQLEDPSGEGVAFADLVLYNSIDNSMVKVEMTKEMGDFYIPGLSAGNYYLTASYVGMDDFTQKDIQLSAKQSLNLGIISFASASVELGEVVVKETRSILEVKADRTVFNVQGTVNSAGSDGIELLRKAPGVLVDNNDNITVLGRTGVLIYVDGKRLPLSGDDLSNYLKSLPAEQIDRIDIITNPGAKYEAEGNAGIIDIRMKRDKNLGGNGTVNGSISQGRHTQGNLGLSGNYRNKKVNTFGSIGYNYRDAFMDMDFNSLQNDISLSEINRFRNNWKGYNFRLGSDIFLNKNHTIGLLLSGGDGNSDNKNNNRVSVASQAMPSMIDSLLIANNTTLGSRHQETYNINYRFDNAKGRSLNVDMDYGRYKNESDRTQPNDYYDANETTLLSSNSNQYDTPNDITIYTFKVDFEEEFLGGKLGVGTKLSRVVSDNTFLVFGEFNGEMVQNNLRSNRFEYEENVYAGYINFARPISKKWSFTAGLRAEQTDATGDLQAFESSLQEDPVELNYLSWFPSAGLSWQVARTHSLALNYSRRINRPDYNVLNPFNNQLNEISFEKGNPFLSPEIVNNIELGYTMSYRYNFKLAYSYTTDQITRLIGPDDSDPRASFITWANLSKQQIISFNASLPFQFTKWWSAYMNIGASHINNQADYGEGAVVDVQAFTYSMYQQHTFNLPWQLKGEVSGYYSGPGVWGGVFKYDPNWSLNLGVQRKFIQDKLNVRLAVNDVFNKSGWRGVSEYDGLVSEGKGGWDSRRVSLSLSYSFGNQNVKSRKRKTGLEDEAGRVGKE